MEGTKYMDTNPISYFIASENPSNNQCVVQLSIRMGTQQEFVLTFTCKLKPVQHFCYVSVTQTQIPTCHVQHKLPCTALTSFQNSVP